MKERDAAGDAALRGELIAAGVSSSAEHLDLLRLIRDLGEVHLTLSDIRAEARARRLGWAHSDQLGEAVSRFAAHGLIRALMISGNEPVFDTVTTPHSHLFDETDGTIVDLDVSPDTLLAIVSDTISRVGGRVELMLKVRRR